jgi:YVTN family beta-propeller protein
MTKRWWGAACAAMTITTAIVATNDRIATAKPPDLKATKVSPTGSMPKAVTVSPDGKKLVVTNFGQWGKHNLYWYDPHTLERIDETNFGGKKKGEEGNAVESVFSPDSKLLYTSNFNENKLMVVDADTHQVVRAIDVGLRPKIVVLSPDGSKLVVANWDSFAATIYDTKDFKQLYKLKVNEHPRGMAITKTGKLYVAGFEGDELDVYDGPDYSQHKKLKACVHVRHMVLSPDNETLYLSCYYLGQLGVWDVATDKMLKRVQIGQEPKSSAVSDDGRYVFIANWGAGENTVSVVDTTDWSHRAVKVPKVDQPCGLALAPDQQTVWITGWSSKTVHAIDASPLGLVPAAKAKTAAVVVPPATTPAAATTTWAGSATWVPIPSAPAAKPEKI